MMYQNDEKSDDFLTVPPHFLGVEQAVQTAPRRFLIEKFPGKIVLILPGFVVFVFGITLSVPVSGICRVSLFFSARLICIDPAEERSPWIGPAPVAVPVQGPGILRHIDPQSLRPVEAVL